ncbi:MAG: hypoxanthine phosphoribosyltransferase [Gemmatimonadota bacterium]
MTSIVGRAGGRTGGIPIERVIFDEQTIAQRVRELGDEITQAYPDGDLLVVGALKGSFIFLSDLVRAIDRPLQVDFLVASSYGSDKFSSGTVRLLYDPAIQIEGRHLLLVEDIIDTGRTLRCLLDLLKVRAPLSLSVCALLDKHLMPSPPPEVRFVGFPAPPAFLVGYGLDYAEEYRHLPFIADLG